MSDKKDTERMPTNTRTSDTSKEFLADAAGVAAERETGSGWAGLATRYATKAIVGMVDREANRYAERYNANRDAGMNHQQASLNAESNSIFDSAPPGY